MLGEGALALGVVALDALDGVAEQVDADWLVEARKEHVENRAPQGERAGIFAGADLAVATGHELFDDGAAVQLFAFFDLLRHALDFVERHPTTTHGLGRQHQHVEAGAGAKLVQRGHALHDDEGVW